jgi:hypothetical protein
LKRIEALTMNAELAHAEIHERRLTALEGDSPEE